jgi:hypothetical protein
MGWQCGGQRAFKLARCLGVKQGQSPIGQQLPVARQHFEHGTTMGLEWL